MFSDSGRDAGTEWGAERIHGGRVVRREVEGDIQGGSDTGHEGGVKGESERVMQG